MSAGRARLAAAMNDRRLELNLRWADVSERGGPTGTTLRALRRGDPTEVAPLTRARLARALEWDRKYVDALLGDGPMPAGEPAEDAAALADIRRRIEHSKVLTDRERPVVLAWCDSPEGQEALREKLAEARQRARIRQG
jgi:hypothetical protein